MKTLPFPFNLDNFFFACLIAVVISFNGKLNRGGERGILVSLQNLAGRLSTFAADSTLAVCHKWLLLG